MLFFICFFSLSFHLILSITQLDKFHTQRTAAICALCKATSCWGQSSKHPSSEEPKPTLPPLTETRSISVPYLQVVTLPVMGKESPSSYADLTLMKYCVREDRGLRTVDVAVPGTSTCSGAVGEYCKRRLGLLSPKKKRHFTAAFQKMGTDIFSKACCCRTRAFN